MEHDSSRNGYHEPEPGSPGRRKPMIGVMTFPRRFQ